MTETSSSVICFHCFRAIDAVLSVLNGNPSRLWLPHDHCNGREGLRPSVHWWGNWHILIEFLTNQHSRARPMFRVGGVGSLLYHFDVFDSAIGMSMNLSRWFHSIKPSQNPATKIPTNFYISMLNVLVNFYSNIKYGTCSSAIRKELSSS